jgi:hypothetical protein
MTLTMGMENASFSVPFSSHPRTKGDENCRKDTKIHEKDTPVDARGKHAQVSDFVDFIEERLEARAGIEPAHKGFADLSLTTWVPRLGLAAPTC